MDEKTLNSWLGLFGAVWRMDLHDMRPDDWMIKVRSADDLEVVLALVIE